ncbi:50S ribosomal subunit protein L6 [Candidatus Glomeribacter gigasporarum BEG34]|uniref:Large ribosomal subunit protein uL6 n=1 Tax=Candidatus Glomeribacter gigasporarum BEG34 TaxID=1070319 RepID=G2J9K5_9BURK|nr:50S ribosomal protein L6 [Candidatus Glomeribacter gigasporarum]CCD29452.1 50S ribosomal subunit protein L6 [Candidatus Glomeribacter gigasporarum BEG34]
MSRIGKKPIALPKDVEVLIKEGAITVKGVLGALSLDIHPLIQIVHDDEGALKFEMAREGRQAKAMLGTTRALVANMVQGVKHGFERKLTLSGVGFRAQVQDNQLSLSVGYSNPVLHRMPEGIKVETPAQTEIVVKGIDKQQVGQVAANVRRSRPPGRYKGEGVRYANEKVILKETKKK